MVCRSNVVGPDEKPWGPYTLAKLKHFANEGRLQRGTLVSRRGSDQWIRAEQLPSVFQPSKQIMVVQQEPSAPKALFSRPNLTCPTCQAGALQRKHVYRTSFAMAVIGYVLLASAVISIFSGMIHGVLVTMPAAASAARNASDTSIVRGELAALIVGGGLCALVGLLGWHLITKKPVLCCSVCGMTIDAA